MQDYVQNLRHRFGTSQALADFSGVSLDTVQSWTAGRRKPTGPALRLLEVLGLLVVNAPTVFDALVSQQAPPVLPTLPEICADFRDGLLRQAATLQAVQHAAPDVGTDEWWYPRTVADPSDTPEIQQLMGFLSSWTKDDEAAFWRSLKDYENRTGRIFPD